MDFKPWPKIKRIENRVGYVFTEKIDGTNACIAIDEEGKISHVQSRNRIITPDDDNFGFAKWVMENKEELEKLGKGYHFGEWWGNGVGRTYGMEKKVFSLFNTRRFSHFHPIPHLVDVVPILPVNTAEEAKEYLQQNGSIATKKYGIEYQRPEGAMMYDPNVDCMFKIIMDK